MPSAVDVFIPSRAYARLGWAGLIGGAICVGFGFLSPFAFIPAFLCGLTGAALFWLAAQPRIEIRENQVNVGTRAIAWTEIREINTGFLVSPLFLDMRLTNRRHFLLVYPGEPERIKKLLEQLRLHSTQATFDGVSYRDFWTWAALGNAEAPPPPSEQPVRMVSPEDEEEIERLYQKLKSVGHLDSRSDSQKPHE